MDQEIPVLRFSAGSQGDPPLSRGPLAGEPSSEPGHLGRGLARSSGRKICSGELGGNGKDTSSTTTSCATVHESIPLHVSTIHPSKNTGSSAFARDRHLASARLPGTYYYEPYE